MGSLLHILLKQYQAHFPLRASQLQSKTSPGSGWKWLFYYVRTRWYFCLSFVLQWGMWGQAAERSHCSSTLKKQWWGKGPPQWGSVQRGALGLGLPGRYLKWCHNKCHCCFQPRCIEQRCWASIPRSPTARDVHSHTRLSWESRVALAASRDNVQPWSFTVLRDADYSCWKDFVIRQGLAMKK